MERPPTPPDMTYNEYRTWRRDNGIRGTTEELSQAWREYTGTTTSPTPSSPTRRSPRRYHDLASASLIGVPREVGELISSRVGRRGIAALQLTSKTASRISDKELERLCLSPVTIREFLRVLRKLGPDSDLAFRIEIRDKTGSAYSSGSALIWNPEGEDDAWGGEEYHSYLQVLTYEEAITELEDYVERFVDQDDGFSVVIGLPPVVMKQVVGERLSCVRRIPELPRAAAIHNLIGNTVRILSPVIPDITRETAETILTQDTPVEVDLPVRNPRRLVATNHAIVDITNDVTHRLRNWVDWMTQNFPEYYHPIPRYVGLEDLRERYSSLVNGEVKRLRELYDALTREEGSEEEGSEEEGSEED